MSQRPLADLNPLLSSFVPFDEAEETNVRQLKYFLEHDDNPYDRSNLVAHVVADALILSPDFKNVVLVKHGITGLWMSPGGHCDGNPDVYASAVREAEEEVGLTDLEPFSDELFDVNVGVRAARRKPEGMEPVHIHFDICFGFTAPKDAPLQISHESTDLAWVSIERISEFDTFPDHMRRIQKVMRLMK
jgi:8-oxo-dGTP pyrophosphatase MutT (NUDIX family)